LTFCSLSGRLEKEKTTLPHPNKQDQKIAAFGSSYRGTGSTVGAAEGCDLLTLLST
jgi:hypothetical protein